MGTAVTLHVALALSVLSAPSLARAQDATRPHARLEYAVDAGAGCPPSEVFRRSIAARLGQDPFTDDAPSTLRATIARGRAGLVGRIAARDAEGRDLGERQVAARTCDALVEAMAVSATLAFDQPALRRPSEPPPVAAPPPPPAAPPSPPAAPPVMEHDPVVALARIDASLVEASAQSRRATRALAIALGVGGAVLALTSLTPLLAGSSDPVGIQRGILSGVSVLGVGTLLVPLFGVDGAARELRALRARRAREAPREALAHTEAAWARAVADERARGTRRGVALLCVGGVLVAGGGVAVGLLGSPDDLALVTTTSLVVGLAGALLAVEGARALTSQGPLEAGWVAYRRWSPLALQPVAAVTPQGAAAGVAGTF